MKKILTVIGARPQFIKAAPVSLALQEVGLEEVLVHTGQHYDANMSAIFFEQLGLKPPNYHLGIGSGSHGYQTGEALIQLEPILETVAPDVVLVYGDTNATLAGALAAAKLHIPVAHVEAGLRSFNRRMPEEINRVMTDHLAQWLFAPTQTAVNNLANEGIRQGVYLSGDVMMDAIALYLEVARAQFPTLLESLGVKAQSYILLTMHRAETTARPEQALAVLQSLDTLNMDIVFPVHPRLRPLLKSTEFRHIHCIDPLSYFEMLLMEESAYCVVTDSGGVQKEAAFFGVPCVTLRPETEWVETVEAGWNQLVDLFPDRMLAAIQSLQTPETSMAQYYGKGTARHLIAQSLKQALSPSEPFAHMVN
ncbi:non-hydrolyzing UDP-N-acetylglucosamine 2-epimerase [Vampirovibrio chlorellavorus]|uniref:non-hydrolyzing UDP-N-acetylglucosamine 2-epimerase n=1 Tax=Vampirovibrio chlorellavorus TaxID=758823 RepID=UPI0026EEA965|nr:UDP-N-acetylglucosamine 2-epimerase (non-hydrolyzing) [Vampirovibrio chlorellavorus]